MRDRFRMTLNCHTDPREVAYGGCVRVCTVVRHLHDDSGASVFDVLSVTMATVTRPLSAQM